MEASAMQTTSEMAGSAVTPLVLEGWRSVRIEGLAPGDTFPIVVQPAQPGVSLEAWAREHRAFVDRVLARHGAVLFRGFGVASVPEFEAIARGFCPDLYGEYNDLPKEPSGETIYGTTPYPSNKTILFHNESSHLHRWPMKQMFFCIQPSTTGGETPIYDGREVLRLLPPAIVDELERKGLCYVRNFSEGIDVSWQQFFHTTDRAEVEAYCAKAGMTCEWLGPSRLRVRRVCKAVVRHPKTGERIFFNQVQLHHVSCLEPAVRKSLLALFSQEDLPRTVTFGDGSPIPDATMKEIERVLWQASRSFPWEKGDVLLLDNMLVAHARKPYTGPRKIVVAIGDIVHDRDL
jgi:alpha-ketoglutarate-dependent taurine dioxygenase